jgi:hypothetical protein
MSPWSSRFSHHRILKGQPSPLSTLVLKAQDCNHPFIRRPPGSSHCGWWCGREPRVAGFLPRQRRAADHRYGRPTVRALKPDPHLTQRGLAAQPRGDDSGDVALHQLVTYRLSQHCLQSRQDRGRSVGPLGSAQGVPPRVVMDVLVTRNSRSPWTCTHTSCRPHSERLPRPWIGRSADEWERRVAVSVAVNAQHGGCPNLPKPPLTGEMLSWRSDSNRQPPVYKTGALPIAPRQRAVQGYPGGAPQNTPVTSGRRRSRRRMPRERPCPCRPAAPRRGRSRRPTAPARARVRRFARAARSSRP